MNPLKHLSPALYATLSNALTLGGALVPVVEHLPGTYAGHYVLLSQTTHVPEGGSQGCYGWSCTALVDIITQFPDSRVSSAPADELLDQIDALLHRQRLPLPANWECGPATFEPSLERRETDGQYPAVRRLVRFRWQVYYHPPTTVVPVPAQSPYYNFLYA